VTSSWFFLSTLYYNTLTFRTRKNYWAFKYWNQPRVEALGTCKPQVLDRK